MDMINPDVIPPWLALPAFIALVVTWRRQVVRERRNLRRIRQGQPATATANTRATETDR